VPTSLNEQITDAISTGNAKVLADMSQSAMGLSIQNAVASQQHVQTIANTALQGFVTLQQTLIAQAAKRLLDTSAEEAVSFTKEVGADLQDKVAQLGTSLASVQQDVKAANTTPPETGIAQQLATLAATITAIQAQLATVQPAPKA